MLSMQERGFGGQYLQVIGDLSTLRYPTRNEDDAVDFPNDLMDRFQANTVSRGSPSIIWGGASKGVIYALLRERFGSPVDVVIDINPAKQGKFIPATGLEVMGPEKGLDGVPAGTIIHVMNPNYLDEIQQMVGPNFICKGFSDDGI